MAAQSKVQQTNVTTIVEAQTTGDVVKSENIAPVTFAAQMPGLLKDYDQRKQHIIEFVSNLETVAVRTGHFTALPNAGCAPHKRPLQDYIAHGVINLDKPPNPSSHEVVAWVKKILEVEKTGHSGTLDPQVTGCLIVAVDKCTRLVKSQQSAQKVYVCVIRFHDKVAGGRDVFEQTCEQFHGAIFQRPPVISAVKRQLRIRTIYGITVHEFDNDRKLGVFTVACEAGTYIRTLCIHMGLIMGCGAHMQELRRVKSGVMDEQKNMFTLHDVLDAHNMWKKEQDESYLRKVIQPLETLLVNYKRIIIKDTAVAAVAAGAQLTIAGLLRYDRTIEVDDAVVIITTKGEAVATAEAQMSASIMGQIDHGKVTRTSRVIMDRDLYPQCWGKGKHATQKKKLIDLGQLDKHGKPNDKTPADWVRNFDYDGNAVSGSNGTANLNVYNGNGTVNATSGDQPLAETTSRNDVLTAPPVEPLNGNIEVPEGELEGSTKPKHAGKEKKSKKGETPEQQRARVTAEHEAIGANPPPIFDPPHIPSPPSKKRKHNREEATANPEQIQEALLDADADEKKRAAKKAKKEEKAKRKSTS